VVIEHAPPVITERKARVERRIECMQCGEQRMDGLAVSVRGSADDRRRAGVDHRLPPPGARSGRGAQQAQPWWCDGGTRPYAGVGVVRRGGLAAVGTRAQQASQRGQRTTPSACAIGRSSSMSASHAWQV
jgi:hypothetical protein